MSGSRAAAGTGNRRIGSESGGGGTGNRFVTCQRPEGRQLDWRSTSQCCCFCVVSFFFFLGLKKERVIKMRSRQSQETVKVKRTGKGRK